MAVIAGTETPVVLVRAGEQAADDHEADPTGVLSAATAYRPVVLGLDTGHPDDAVLALAFEEAARRGTALRVVHGWMFSSGPLDASASEREIPPVPGVKKAMVELDARDHVTFGGCLEEGAKGWVARMILRNGKGGDFRDFTAIETWAAHVADELTHT